MKKLVLFDIDGTLIRSIRIGAAVKRFSYGIKRAYGVSLEFTSESWDKHNFNGMVDRAIVWELVRKLGVTREKFLGGLSIVKESFREFLEELSKTGPVYALIPEAKKLVEQLQKDDSVAIGVITGNVGPAAEWKLRHVGLHEHFLFGVYGHEADKRDELASLALVKAKDFFKEDFLVKNTFIIGDTVHDIRCGKAIGAKTIAVTTGLHVDSGLLKKEHPDLLVDSLMDPRVVSLIEHS